MQHADWWRGAALYQIYPRSFQDTNGDGVGDLAGVLLRLDYVASLGVDGIWLSPFFPSPMRDFGYDVSDYLGVDPVFGTLAQFDAVIAQAHALGLKVIIDQVWSHTAAEHPWFQQSRMSRDNPRTDWYVWADAKPDGTPPNNWQSWMGGSAWRWEPRRRQYHLHNFLPQMPDLNFHCSAVQDAILDVARFWLDRGVDGFRLDTANLYFHDLALRDNPALPPGEAGDSPVLMQRHEYNANRPETLPFLERLRALLDRYPGRMAVGEIGGADSLPRMIEYTHGASRLHTAYSFALLGDRHDPAYVATCLAPWAEESTGGAHAWPSWALSNHDAPRVASRWGAGGGGSFAFGGTGTLATVTDQAGPGATPHLYLALLVALRGTIFLYQGEELGLPQSAVAFEDLQDPFGKAHWPLNKGRDGCRTPMPWEAAASSAGFTNGTPWLPLDFAHRALAVDAQERDPSSTLAFTRTLLALRRQHAALRLGNFDVEQADDSLLIVRRRHQDDVLWLAFNLGAVARQVLAPKGAREAILAVQSASARCAHVDLPAHSAVFLRLAA
ncbi:MAG: alpha-amylase family glycosyl hydrolase [Steroidobacteraceae bacterium]